MYRLNNYFCKKNNMKVHIYKTKKENVYGIQVLFMTPGGANEHFAIHNDLLSDDQFAWVKETIIDDKYCMMDKYGILVLPDNEGGWWIFPEYCDGLLKIMSSEIARHEKNTPKYGW